MAQRVVPVTHPRRRDRQRTAGRPTGAQAEVGFALAGSQALPRGRLQDLQLGIVMRRPMCSISHDPGRDECTICTAVAPDAVFTVRTYGDTRPTLRPRA
jgi:hypothetical protein